ncbi:MAG: RNHCP domain-containing protein [Candidatus Paceibacterota bacterium]
MFKKRIEDFKCENCGEYIRGDGYTNHCHRCLWSKHVDVDPGDRAAECGGMMPPVAYHYTASEKWVIHECLFCGKRKKNKLHKKDRLDALTGL